MSKTTKESFEKRIDRILTSLDTGESGTAYEETKSKLRKICDRIEAGLRGGAKKALVVSLQPGFQATMGQQLNVVVEIPERHFQDTLFRAYVPLAGQPIQLDFYGEEPTETQTLEEMEDAIIEFLNRPEIKGRLNDYRSLARK